LKIVIAAAIDLLASGAAFAQGVPMPSPGPMLPPVPVAGAAAAKPAVEIPPEKTISFAQALAAVEAAQAACKGKNAVVEVVDLNGNIKVLYGADGTPNSSYGFLPRKATTALQTGKPSGANGRGMGGLPIFKNGEVIGALAVSGSTGPEDDEACARAGIATFHF
jgi:uncharacterized protein GlcG (DUF336 family)